MDVARGILDRLVERPELEVQVAAWMRFQGGAWTSVSHMFAWRELRMSQEEILFLKECLGSNLETLAMPCMLLQRDTGCLADGHS